MLCTSVCLKLRLFVFAYDCYWNEDNSHSAQHLHTHVLIGSYFKKLGAFRFRRCVESSIDIINVENHAFSHKVIVFIWNRRYTICSHDYRSMHRCQGGRIYARLHGIRDAQWMQRHHQPNIYTEHIVFHAKCNQIAPHDCVHICYLSSVLFIVIVARLIVWVPANIFWGGVMDIPCHSFFAAEFSAAQPQFREHYFSIPSFNIRFKTTLQQLDGVGLTFG